MSVAKWIQLADSEATDAKKCVAYERGLQQFPGSYKLWYRYLGHLVMHCRGRRPDDASISTTCGVFERATLAMPTFPRLGLMYFDFLVSFGQVSLAHNLLDRMLRSLPEPQHRRVWKKYESLALRCQAQVPELMTDIRSRRVGSSAESFQDVMASGLSDHGASLGDSCRAWLRASLRATVESSDFLTDEDFQTFFSFVQQEAEDVRRIFDVERLAGLRISRDGTNQALIWTLLADFYIRLGWFERARAVFERALESVGSAHDFAAVWNAYIQFEEKLLSVCGEAGGEGVELQLKKLEALLEHQPFFLNDVQLRQTPSDVHVWQKRAGLYARQGDLDMAVRTFSEATGRIDARRADGKKHSIWISFAAFYEDQGDVESARRILEKSLLQTDLGDQEKVIILTEFAELECRQGRPDKAIWVLEHQLFGVEKQGAASDGARSTRGFAYAMRSPVIWSLYADLQETTGAFSGACAAYEQAIDATMATPQMILNYAALLEEEGYFERAFSVYERGVGAFGFPNSLGLWVAYLSKFVQRYGSAKIERARDLFEQLCTECPAEHAKVFFLMYAEMEENHGLARRAMVVYEQAVKRVHEKDRLALTLLFAKKALAFFGAARAREVFSAALESLPDTEAQRVAVTFANMEAKLGEVERARAIFLHAAQLSGSDDFFDRFAAFETRFGNAETFKTHLRVKRVVQNNL